MNRTKNDPGSFRDPAGHVLLENDRVFRGINLIARDEFTTVHQSGLLQQLIEQKKLIDYTILSDAEKSQRLPDAALLLEHPKLPFISYAYEWSFDQLKAAALLQLELHLAALKHSITIIDASSFNIQFIGAEPCFIDHLSFRPYHEGEIWWGYQQFCLQYLNPLLLQSYCGIDFQTWLKGGLGNIPLNDLYQVLPWSKKFNWKVFFHLGLQTKLQKKSSAKQNSTVKKVQLPKSALINLLTSMQNWISQLKPRYKNMAEWQHYENLHLYTDQALKEKKSFIAEFCQTSKPQCVWDLGCNQGEYAKIALENSVAQVIGFDYDSATIDKAFLFSKKHDLNFLPLVMNFANPTPAMGWELSERKSLSERNNANALFALAFIHHLRIQNNIPLTDIIRYLFSLAPTGVIEFIPKTDPKVRLLLKFRQDIFHDYNYDNFIQLIQEKASILKTISLTGTERLLISYRIRN